MREQDESSKGKTNKQTNKNTNKKTVIQNDICTLLFIATLLTIANTGNN